MPSIIFGPFRLLSNAHLFNWLFRWLVGVDMWCLSCKPEVRIRRRVREKIRRISNLLKTFEVRTLSNSNANFVTSLMSTVRVYKHYSQQTSEEFNSHYERITHNLDRPYTTHAFQTHNNYHHKACIHPQRFHTAPWLN